MASIYCVIPKACSNMQYKIIELKTPKLLKRWQMEVEEGGKERDQESDELQELLV